MHTKYQVDRFYDISDEFEWQPRADGLLTLRDAKLK